MRRALAAACLTAAALLASAAPAVADAYDQVLTVYEATGTVPPCEFSSHQLSAALGGVDTYGAQYFADFTAAIQTALAQRAGGACTPHRARRPAGGSLRAVRLPASATSPTDAGFPAPILLMAAVGLLAALAAALIALARAVGWDPAWPAAWRHGLAEALYRIEGRLGARAQPRRARRPS